MADNDLIVSVLRMLQDQQKLTEKTSQLVENLTQDLSRLRGSSDQVGALQVRLESLEREAKNHLSDSKDCQERISRMLYALDGKREQNKDRIAELEKKHEIDMSKLRTELETVIETVTDKVGSKAEQTAEKQGKDIKENLQSFTEFKEKFAWQAGKFGAMAGIGMSILLFILKYLIESGHKLGGNP